MDGTRLDPYNVFDSISSRDVTAMKLSECETVSPPRYSNVFAKIVRGLSEPVAHKRKTKT